MLHVHRPDAAWAALKDSRLERLALMNFVLKSGLLASDGALWRRRRDLIGPLFGRALARLWGEQVSACLADRLPQWDWIARQGLWLDVGAEMQSLTLDVMGRAMLGRATGGQEDPVSEATDLATRLYANENCRMLGLPPPEHEGIAEQWVSSSARLSRFIHSLLAARRCKPPSVDDFVGCLVEGVRRGELSESDAHDELLSMLFAGHETTAVALTWAWAGVESCARARASVVAETERVIGAGVATAERFGELEATRRCWLESLRCFPPVWINARTPNHELELFGFQLRPGDRVVCCPWLSHRHPDSWPDPDRFDPDRFLPERERQRSPHAFQPFGVGAHTCVGVQQAHLEGILVLATLLHRYRAEFAPLPPPAPSFTSRPAGAVRARLQLR